MQKSRPDPLAIILFCLIGISVLYSFYKFTHRAKDTLNTFLIYHNLTNEERRKKILDSLGYGKAYRLIQNIQKVSQDTENILVVNTLHILKEPLADFLWKADYFLCPRDILNSPSFLMYNKEWFNKNRVRWVIYTNGTKIQFFPIGRFISPNILLINPGDKTIVFSPPTFKWKGKNREIYSIEFFDENGIKIFDTYQNLGIKLEDIWITPESLWIKVPHNTKIYWRIKDIVNKKFSEIRGFIKR